MRFHQRLTPAFRATVEIGPACVLGVVGPHDLFRGDGRQVNGAIAEIDDLLRMSDDEGGARVGGVAVISAARRVAPHQRVGHAAILNALPEPAIANLLVTAAPVRRQPDLEQD